MKVIWVIVEKCNVFSVTDEMEDKSTEPVVLLSLGSWECKNIAMEKCRQLNKQTNRKGKNKFEVTSLTVNDT